jgi:hypothetical protein
VADTVLEITDLGERPSEKSMRHRACSQAGFPAVRAERRPVGVALLARPRRERRRHLPVQLLTPRWQQLRERQVPDAIGGEVEGLVRATRTMRRRTSSSSASAASAPSSPAAWGHGGRATTAPRVSRSSTTRSS